MKVIDRVVFAAFGFLCMTIAACSKVETDPYSERASPG